MSVAEEKKDPLVGRVLGDFVLRDKIGEGGFGAVYRADQRTLAREAVVKVLSRQHQASEPATRRFLLEAHLASRLDHPYAAHIYAFGAETDGVLWIAMELVRGTPLDQLLRSRGPLPLDRLVPLLDAICEVVHTAHEQGIVHRDLKPANVLVLARAGKFLPKLLDFGIAKLLDARAAAPGAAPPAGGPPAGGEMAETMADAARDVTQSGGGTTPAPAGGITQRGAVMGSPLYMAPEQWVDPTSADARTDVYALGILAFEALTGRPPFTGRSLLELARLHGNAAVPPLGAGFPAGLDEVLGRALAKQRTARYQTAIELAAAFRAASGIAPTSREAIPGLEDAIRDAITQSAPQPIAEAVSALDAARNVHQARDAIRELVRVVLRMLGLLALAARTRVGAGGDRDAEAVLEPLRQLRRRSLDDDEWLALSRELCRPFARRRAAHPLPELVALYFDEDGTARDAIGEALTLPVLAEHAGALSEGQVREQVAASVPGLARLLRGIAFLADYPLVVGREGWAERWVGVRKPRRAVLSAVGGVLVPRQVALLDAEGRAVLSLSPLLQVAPPAPGLDEEIFLFEGRGRLGARLVARPHDLERHDESLWEWFGTHLMTGAEDKGAGGGGDDRPPYLGLATFDSADADRFFGREREVESFLNRLRRTRFLAVVGPSGAGKSSFVQAGVVPSLPAGWRAVTLRPGANPTARLAEVSEAEILVIDQFEELFTLCQDDAERRDFAQRLFAPDAAWRVVITLRDDFLARASELPVLRELLAAHLVLLTTPSGDDLVRIVTEPARRAGYDFEDAELPARMAQEVLGRPGALPLLSFCASKLWELRDRHFHHLPRRAYDVLGGVAGALAQHAEDTLLALGTEEQRLVREAFRHLVTAEGTRAVLTHPELVQLLGGGGRAEAVIEKLVAARLIVAAEGEGGAERIEVIHEALFAAWPRLAAWRREDVEGARLRDQLRGAARQWLERGRPRGLLWRDESLTEYQLWRARTPGALTQAEQDFAQASLADAARGRWLRRGALAAAFVVLAVFAGIQVRANQKIRDARELAEQNARQAERRLTESWLEQGRQTLLAGRHTEALAYLAAARERGIDTAPVRFMIARALEAVSPERRSLEAAAGQMWQASFSPDGTRLVSADDGAARVWDAATGRLVASFAERTGGVHRAHFAPDGRRVVTWSRDGGTRLWDVDTGARVFEQPGPPSIGGDAFFSPDGTRLATINEDEAAIHLWDPGGARIAEVTGDEAGNAGGSFSADGARLAVAGLGGRVVLATRDGAPLAALDHGGADTQGVAWSRSGDRLVVASWNGVAYLWSLGGRCPDDATGADRVALADGGGFACRRVLSGHGDKVDHATFSPDGKLVLTAGRDGTARLWSAGDGALLRVLRGHSGMIWHGDFDPSSRRVVTAGEDRSAILWDAASGRRIAVLEGHGASLHFVQFSPDGKRIATSSWDGTALIWDAPPDRAARRAPPPGKCVLASNAGPLVGAYVLACSEASEVRLPGVPEPIVLPGADHAAIDDAGTIVILARGPIVEHWRLPERVRIGEMRLPAPASWVASSADGVHTIAVGPGLEPVLFSAGGKPTTLALGAVTRVAFAPDGRRLVTAEGRRLRLHDAQTGAALRELELPAEAEALRFSPDGVRLAALLAAPEVMIWRLDDGTHLVLRGHAAPTFDVRFDRAGARVVTASGDATARVWDATTGATLTVLAGSPQFVYSADFDPSGELVFTTGGDGAVRIWDAAAARPLFVLDAHRTFGVEVRFRQSGTLLSRAQDGETYEWTLPAPPHTPDELARTLACRTWVRFDAVQGLVPDQRPKCPVSSN